MLVLFHNWDIGKLGFNKKVDYQFSLFKNVEMQFLKMHSDFD